MAEKIKYNAYDAFAIKDDIKRGVYFHNHFWNDDAQIIDNRISEWIELHENGTFVESSENYVQSLINMIVILHQSKNQIRNYNFLFLTSLINFYNFGTEEEARNTLMGFEKEDFKIWIRSKKILSLMNKITKD